jgi:hypothetical protein
MFVIVSSTIHLKKVTDSPNIYPMRDGHAVSRSSDFIIYSVEAEFIERVVAEYGPCKQTFLKDGFILIAALSYQSACDRCWSNICEISRKGRF